MQDRLTVDCNMQMKHTEPPGKFIPGGSFFDLRLFTRAF